MVICWFQYFSIVIWHCTNLSPVLFHCLPKRTSKKLTKNIRQGLKLMNQKAPSDGTGNVLQKKVLFCQGVRFQTWKKNSLKLTAKSLWKYAFCWPQKGKFSWTNHWKFQGEKTSSLASFRTPWAWRWWFPLHGGHHGYRSVHNTRGDQMMFNGP